MENWLTIWCRIMRVIISYHDLNDCAMQICHTDYRTIEDNRIQKVTPTQE